MIRHLLLALALAAGVSSAAQAQTAQVIPTCGSLSAPLPLGPGGRFYTDQNGTLCTTAGSGGGGSGGTVTQGAAATDTAGNRWPVLAYQGGAWSVGITGTLPAFAATPTFRIDQTTNGTTNAVYALNSSYQAAGGSSGFATNVQGTAGGVPMPVSGTVATSNGALDATVTARLGTLGQKAMAGSAPVTIASDQTPLPNQAAQTFIDVASGTSVAASASTPAPTHDLGAMPIFSKYNAFLITTQAGTFVIQGSNDNFATATNLYSNSVAAGSQTLQTFPVLYRYVRAFYVNGSSTTASTVSLQSSFTLN